VSLLTARVTVYDADGQVVGSAADADPRDGDVIVRIDDVNPQSTYYVAVEAARADEFGVGGYTLRVAHGSMANVPAAAVPDWINQVATGGNVALNASDAHTNDTVTTATSLAPTGSRFDYAARASIGDATDRDVYQVTAPAGGTVLTAMAWGTPTRGLLTAGQHVDPLLAVYDAAGNRLPAHFLSHDGFSFAVQVPDTTPGATYYVEVSAGPGGTSVGNYFLGADFGGTEAGLTTLSIGDLAAGAASAADALSITRGGLFHFVLAANGSVGMTVRDVAGTVVFALGTAGGRVSGNVVLGPGQYTVTFAAGGGAVRYSLRGARLNDPIGPDPVDPTEDPSGPSDTNPDWDYLWAAADSDDTTHLPPVDPIGDPYTIV
jgi:hypothetical protein